MQNLSMISLSIGETWHFIELKMAAAYNNYTILKVIENCFAANNFVLNDTAHIFVKFCNKYLSTLVVEMLLYQFLKWRLFTSWTF